MFLLIQVVGNIISTISTQVARHIITAVVALVVDITAVVLAADITDEDCEGMFSSVLPQKS